jgi:hypothetical protein|tara:strand:- start:1701 stop:1895 length:195 start_codon:yes stop_codon:yes gene_type:complete
MIEFKLSEKDLQKLEVVLKSRRVPLTKHEIRTFFIDQLKKEYNYYLIRNRLQNKNNKTLLEVDK